LFQVDLQDDVHAALEVEAQFDSGRGEVFFPPVRHVVIQRRGKGQGGKEQEEDYKPDFELYGGVH
jgi:hypothetical protein